MGILRLALGEGTTNMKLLFSLVLLPWLWPTPSPRLMPTPTTATTAWATTVLDTDSVTTDTVLATTDTPVLDTTATTARGPLTPSPLPPLMPRLIPTTDTTALDITDTDTTVLDTAPTDTVLATTATAMVCTDTTDKCPADSNHPKTSLGTTSSENGLFSLVHSPPVLPVSVPPG